MNHSDLSSADEEPRTTPRRHESLVLPRKLFPEHIELNVGGKLYDTTVTTLTRFPNNLIGKMFTGQVPISKDAKGRYFIDRDGEMFSHILNFLRTRTLELRDDFENADSLLQEAEYYRMDDLKRLIQSHAASTRRLKERKPASGHISLHVRANFAITVGRNAAQVEHPFRKIHRIFVCGKVSLCQEVFDKDLNETRESHPDQYRYTNRLFLRHSQLEKAFAQLRDHGFRLINSNGDGVGAPFSSRQQRMKGDWSHFSIFVFFR